VFLSDGFDLGPHSLVCEGAKRQAKRRVFVLDSGDDRLGGADKIARLISAVALDLAAAPDRRLRVGVDGFLWRLQRTAGPVGAEGARFDDDDLDSKRRDLLRQGFGEAFDGELRRRAIAGTRETDEAADRRDVDDRARLLRAHDRQRRARHGREAKKIGVEHRPRVGIVAFLDGREIAVAGGVDENIDAAEPSFGRLDRGLDLILLVSSLSARPLLSWPATMSSTLALSRADTTTR
jgi:hypothetical protein